MLKSIFQTVNRRRTLQIASCVNLFGWKSNNCFHSSPRIFGRIFKETENEYAFSIISQSATEPKFSLISAPLPIANVENISELLNQNWRTESTSKITDAFKIAAKHAQDNYLAISDPLFNNIVDRIIDNCEHLADEELAAVLSALQQFQPTETVHSNNFCDLWNCLDFICCSRVKKWSPEQLFAFEELWYKLNLARICDFTEKCLEKLSRRLKSLSKQQLLQMVFFINVHRKQIYDMFELEHCIGKHLDGMSSAEIGVFAMCFFKTQAHIKDPVVLNAMIRRVVEEAASIEDIALTSILKAIRFSPHVSVVREIELMLRSLRPQIPRLSVQSCIHLVLAGTQSNLLCEDVLRDVAEKFAKDIKKLRLKDLERTAFALTMFGVETQKEPCIFEKITGELLSEDRAEEKARHPRSLACCLYFLSLRQTYLPTLISQCLDLDFISNTYGKNRQNIGREIFYLDRSLEVECPDYSGNRLDAKFRSTLVKYAIAWTPTRADNKKISNSDLLTLELVESFGRVQGGETFAQIIHVLPHFQIPDIIICFDKDNNPVVPDLSGYNLEDIKRPRDPTLKWFAVVIGGWNAVVRYEKTPLGLTRAKMRQLQRMGYKTFMVHWEDFLPLPKPSQDAFVRDLIKNNVQ